MVYRICSKLPAQFSANTNTHTNKNNRKINFNKPKTFCKANSSAAFVFLINGSL